MTTSIRYSHREVVRSADGTTIEYHSVGSGSPVLVVPGALASARDYLPFASALGRRFTVHVLERRGRGGSGSQGEHYGIESECEDLLAVAARTGARAAIGHSFGGLVVLETARRDPRFDRIALYEPGVSLHHSIPMGWMPRYEALLAQGRLLDAFAVFSMGTGPDRGRRMPVWLMRRLLPRFVSPERLASMTGLLEQNLREHRVVASCDDHLGTYRAIRAEVLLMRGGRTGIRWVDQATTALAGALPNCTTVEFPALTHFGIDQEAPEEVAERTAPFLEAH